MTFLLFFLPLTLALYFCRKSISWRNGVLLVASLVFYSWDRPVWIFAMLASTAVNYVAAIKLAAVKRRRQKKRMWMLVGVGFSLGMLFVFKYSAFFLNGLLSLFGARISGIEMPIGISFYTFQIITYTVDVYRGTTPVQKRFSRLLLYVCCFPQLIAGPIVRYDDVAKQLQSRESTMDDFSGGMSRFVVGLSKKVLLANICGAALEKTALATGGAALSFIGAWYSALLYTLQIYFDFSAYSDMAIGLGRVFGFRYRENFNYPYISKGISEFWRRWHISLGTFFREYVYIPLGGNRGGALLTARNLMIVWELTGLWHGASANFVLWGLYYGALQLLERFILGKVWKKLPSIFTWFVTLVLVMIGWMLFYYTDVSCAFRHIGAMLGMGSGGLLDATTRAVMRRYSLFPLIACICALPVAPMLRRLFARRADMVRIVCATLLFVISVMALVGQSYNPFIYFRF
jgi:alginate O-acetyltransferase complex protein AlgI